MLSATKSISMTIAQGDLAWLAETDWITPIVLITLAVGVLMWSRRFALQRSRGAQNDSAERDLRGTGARALDFDLEIARLEEQAAVPIAAAKPGLVHIRGRIASAHGSLGGPADRQRIYYNRAGAPRSAAIGVELCLVADDSGQVALEQLESARVIATPEGNEELRYITLQVGDQVEVLGEFEAERVSKKGESAKEKIYGVIGRNRQLQLRVLQRGDASTASAPEAPADPPQAPN